MAISYFKSYTKTKRAILKAVKSSWQVWEFYKEKLVWNHMYRWKNCVVEIDLVSFKFSTKLLQPRSILYQIPDQSVVNDTIILARMYLLTTEPK